MTEKLEEWRPVVGWEGFYEVSNMGRIRSLDRAILRPNGGSYLHRGRVLRPKITNRGYPSVGLQVNGEGVFVTVHRMVALAFVPNPRGLSEVNHIDGDKANACAENLEWCSRQENCLHSTKMRLNPVPSLSDDQVREVVRMSQTGASRAEICAAIGASRDAVKGILRGRHYGWVSSEATQ